MDALSVSWHVLTETPAVFAAVGGVAWGIIGGALPGIAASITMALLLPFTYSMDPISAIIMLGSAYVGCEYGGSIPSILIRTPGTSGCAASVFDGYAMQEQGRGGEALGISLISGFTGGLVGIVMLVSLTGALAAVALAFKPPAYFSLGILGLSVIASLSGKSIVKGLIAAVIGMMFATVGMDPMTGVDRFVFDIPELYDGIPFLFVMIGVFAVTELMMQAGSPIAINELRGTRIKLPSLRMWRRLLPYQLLGSAIGTFEGCMPGAGGSVSAFMSYNEAKRWSKNGDKFGTGMPEGIAAPEASNNTVASTALVPMLAFGIPGSNSSAILLGGLLMHGINPGPLLFEENSNFVYGLFSGLAVANLSLVFVGIAIMAPCVWLVNRPRPYLYAFIYALILSGTFSVHQQLFDLWMVLAAGILGYVMRLFGFPFLPLILALVLGEMVQSNYRRSLVLSRGDHSIFIEDPVSAGLLVASILLVAFSVGRNIYSDRKARIRTATAASSGGGA